ncbi:MAG: hypothetical protein LBF91_03190 [Azoarcus sp.]|jgi:hypothetical protein|nr:hypothetical protein [Azoarcus sp.]
MILRKRHRILFALLRLGVFTALCWGVLWLAPPIDLVWQSPAALAGLHFGPPLALEGLWQSLRRAWRWRGDRATRRQAEKVAAENAAALAGQQAAAPPPRLAGVECRAVWMALPRAPSWYDGPSQAAAPPDASAGRGDPLHPILSKAFQNAAAPWLPLYLADAGGSAASASARIESAWRRALPASDDARTPAFPGCKTLPGAGPLPDRLISLFDEDPSLPALILLGLDGPAEKDAVAALLVSRPGLFAAVPDLEAGEDVLPDGSPHLPYWERARRERNAKTDGARQWGEVPPAAQAALLAAPVIATLHRTHSSRPAQARLARTAQERIAEALENAGLREPPREAAEAAPPDLGEIRYNGGPPEGPENGQRLAALVTALYALDGEIDPIRMTRNVNATAPEVTVMSRLSTFAEALVQSARLRKPVLLAEFDGEGDVRAGIVRPACA